MDMDKETKGWMKFTTWTMYGSAIVALLSFIGLVWVIAYQAAHATPSIIVLGYTFFAFGTLALLSRRVKNAVFAHLEKMEQKKQH